MGSAGARRELKPRQFVIVTEHTPVGDGGLARGIHLHVPAVARAPPRKRRVDRAMRRRRNAAHDGPIDLAHPAGSEDRKSTRLNSSHANSSYAAFCLKKKKTQDL